MFLIRSASLDCVRSSLFGLFPRQRNSRSLSSLSPKPRRGAGVRQYFLRGLPFLPNYSDSNCTPNSIHSVNYVYKPNGLVSFHFFICILKCASFKCVCTNDGASSFVRVCGCHYQRRLSQRTMVSALPLSRRHPPLQRRSTQFQYINNNCASTELGAHTQFHGLNSLERRRAQANLLSTQPTPQAVLLLSPLQFCRSDSLSHISGSLGVAIFPVVSHCVFCTQTNLLQIPISSPACTPYTRLRICACMCVSVFRAMRYSDYLTVNPSTVLARIPPASVRWCSIIHLFVVLWLCKYIFTFSKENNHECIVYHYRVKDTLISPQCRYAVDKVFVCHTLTIYAYVLSMLYSGALTDLRSFLRSFYPLRFVFVLCEACDVAKHCKLQIIIIHLNFRKIQRDLSKEQKLSLYNGKFNSSLTDFSIKFDMHRLIISSAYFHNRGKCKLPLFVFSISLTFLNGSSFACRAGATLLRMDCVVWPITMHPCSIQWVVDSLANRISLFLVWTIDKVFVFVRCQFSRYCVNLRPVSCRSTDDSFHCGRRRLLPNVLRDSAAKIKTIFKYSFSINYIQETIINDVSKCTFSATDVRVANAASNKSAPVLGSASSIPSSSSTPGSKTTRNQRKAILKKNKRVRSDDSTGLAHPSKKPNTFAPVRTVVADDLCVVIDNLLVPNGALSDIEIDQIRYELSLQILNASPSEFAPTFEFAGSNGGYLRLRCMNYETKDWLFSKISFLNTTLTGAKLRVRVSPLCVAGFFPIPRQVGPEFLTGLLLRQNRGLFLETWRLTKFEERKGKDPANPSTGAGYFAIFEVDEKSLTALKERKFQVHFSMTSVILRPVGKQTPLQPSEDPMEVIAAEDIDSDGVDGQ